MNRPLNTLKSAPAGRWKVALGGSLFLLLLLAVYWPAIRGGFIWDDDAYVTNNPLLTKSDGWQRIWFSAHSQSQFFPLVFTTLRLEYQLWGLNPLGYHLVNVLLHAANVLLLWGVLKKLAVPGAWIAAALFAFHPVQVETVAWVAELKNTLSTLFYLLALFMWLRFLRPGASQRRDYWLTLIFYLLALCSKTTACTLPLALLLVPWMQGERIGWRRVLQIVPFLVLGAAAGLVSIWWESHLGNYRGDVGQSLTLLQRILIAARALWFYAGKLVWPADLTFSYPHWEMSIGHAVNYLWLAGCLAVAFSSWVWREYLGRRTLAAVIFFAGTMVPLLGFVPLYTFRYSYVADHYQYVAGIGLLTLAAAGLARIPRAISVALIAILGLLSWNQSHIYRNETALWKDTLAKNPGSWMAHSNLGLVFKNEGDFDQAIRQYREAIRLKPDFAQGHYNLGIVLFKTGQTEQGIAEFQEAIRLDPGDSRTYYNYAVGLDAIGRADEAVNQYEAAIRVEPDYVAAHMNLGVVFSHQSKVDEALTQFQATVRLAPDDAEAHNDLGALLRAKGRIDAATGHFQEAIRLNPSHALAHANLGSVLLGKGDLEEAIHELQEAVRLNPDDGGARAMLTEARARKEADNRSPGAGR